MANNCFVGIDILTASPEDAERLYENLKAAKKAADERQEGIFIGCPNRYLFDADTVRIDDTLFISGWVKWGFNDAEVWQFLAWLMKQAALVDFRMTYDEGGCLLYGEYRYDMKTLTDRYLPQDKFPTGEGEDVDTELAFSKHGVTRIIDSSCMMMTREDYIDAAMTFRAAAKNATAHGDMEKAKLCWWAARQGIEYARRASDNKPRS